MLKQSFIVSVAGTSWWSGMVVMSAITKAFSSGARQTWYLRQAFWQSRTRLFSKPAMCFFFVVLWELGEKEQVQTADAGDVSAFSTPPISRLPGSSMVPLIKLQKLSVTRDVACHKLQGKCIMSYQQIYFSVGTVFSWGCILLHLLFCRDHNCCFGPELVLAHLMEASWESLQSREMG